MALSASGNTGRYGTGVKKDEEEEKITRPTRYFIRTSEREAKEPSTPSTTSTPTITQSESESGRTSSGRDRRERRKHRDRRKSSPKVNRYTEPEPGTTIEVEGGGKLIYVGGGQWSYIEVDESGKPKGSHSVHQKAESELTRASGSIITQAGQYGVKPSLILKKREGEGYVLTTREPIVVKQQKPPTVEDYKAAIEKATGMKWEEIPPHIREMMMQDINKAVAAGAAGTVMVTKQKIPPPTPETIRRGVYGTPLDRVGAIAAGELTVREKEQETFISPEARMLAREVPIPSIAGAIGDVAGVTGYDPERAKFFAEQERHLAKKSIALAVGLELQKRGEWFYEESSKRIPYAGPIIGAVGGGTASLAGSVVKLGSLSGFMLQDRHGRLILSAAAAEAGAGILEAMAIGKAIGVGARAVGKGAKWAAERPIVTRVRAGAKPIIEPIKAKATLKDLFETKVELREAIVVGRGTPSFGGSKSEIVQRADIGIALGKEFDDIIRVVYGYKSKPFTEIRMSKTQPIREHVGIFSIGRVPIARSSEVEKAGIIKGVRFTKSTVYTSQEPFALGYGAVYRVGRCISPFKRDVMLLRVIAPEKTVDIVQAQGRILTRVYTKAGTDVFEMLELPKEIDLAKIGARRIKRIKTTKPLTFEEVKPETLETEDVARLVEDIFGKVEKSRPKVEKPKAASSGGVMSQLGLAEGEIYEYIVPRTIFPEPKPRVGRGGVGGGGWLPPFSEFEVPLFTPILPVPVKARPTELEIGKVGGRVRTRTESIQPQSLDVAVTPRLDISQVTLQKEVQLTDTVTEQIMQEITDLTEVTPDVTPDMFADFAPPIFSKSPLLRAPPLPFLGVGGGGKKRGRRTKSWVRNERQFIRQLLGFSLF